MLPLNDNGLLSGLLCGFLFGFVLENAGFGSPRKLTAQFRLRDWSVFKVMFTAIVVAACGLWLLRVLGIMRPDAVFVPPAMLLASALGGALVGAGFAVGGYCPGTSVVGLFSGRLDALAFLAGLLLGTTVFAGLYGQSLRAILALGEMVEGDTFTDVWAIPEPWILLLLLAALAGIYRLGNWFERRGPGPVDAREACTGRPAPSAGV